MTLSATGCARSRYELATPALVPIEAGGTPVSLPSRDGVNYELRQVDNKLVLRFVNTSAAAIELSATSELLDSTGASYPVEPQKLGSMVSGRVILPPRVEQSSRWSPAPSEAGSPTDDGVFSVGRVPLTAYQREPVRTFDWPVDASATVRLRWTIEGKPIEHEFVVRRVRG